METVMSPSTPPNRRQKWTKQQYKEIIWAYQYAKKIEGEGTTLDTYRIWRDRNPDIFPGMNPKNLSNQRRFILRENKLTESEINEIISDVASKVLECEIDDDPTKYIERHVPDTCDSSGNLGTTAVEEMVDMENKIISKLYEVKKHEIGERKFLNKIKNIKQVSKKIEMANKVLTKFTTEKNMNLTEINELIYATAAVIANEKIVNGGAKIQLRNTGWKERIQRVIDDCRKDLSYIKEFRSGNSYQKVETRMKTLLEKAALSTNQIDELEQNITMKLQVKAQRLKRYSKRNDQFHQNRIFKNDAKQFYRQITARQSKVTNPPEQQAVELFWKDILENEKSYNIEANWIDVEETLYKEMKSPEWKKLEINEMTTVIKFSHNWKTPGADKVHNFWLKYLTSMHKQLLEAFNEILKEPHNMPRWMTEGTAYLLPKSTETRNPKNYRPITCLPTTYKILTAILSNRIYNHLQENQILPEEQKGCRKGSRGCKDSLLISQMIVKHAKKIKNNLNITWIDYRKAFDSIPHAWIIRVMEIYKVCDVIVRFIQQSMLQWNMIMMLMHEKGCLKTGKISVRRGIFQGDSLSPLLFCMALIPLSKSINDARLGYELEKEQISHLFYMDDLKIFSKDHKSMQMCVSIVEKFSRDIGMEFGTEKCATIEMKKGKVTRGGDITLLDGVGIQSLKTQEFYKYLGMDEKNGINDRVMKEKVKREYFSRAKKVLKTQLNSKNKIMAINSLATPVMMYSFGILPWLKSEIEKLDRKTRKILTMNGMHHPRADVDRLYIKRKDGGRGLLELQSLHQQSILSLAEYIRTEDGRLIQMVRKNDDLKRKFSLQKEANKIQIKYKLITLPENKNLICQLKKSLENEKMSKIANKPLHGKFFKHLEGAHINKELSVKWLTNGRLKGETESLLVAAQDQALNTRYHQRHILGQSVKSVCRLCLKAEEHISHIVAGCEVLAPVEYLQRHNKVAGYIHWRICKSLNLPVTEKYYMHEPEKVTKVEDNVIMWDKTILTDRTILANRPDLVILNKNEKNCLIVDVAVPDDVNVLKKETEKRLKYKDLQIEISRMWNVQTKVVAVVVGALGTVSDNFNKEIQSIPGKPSAEDIQNIAMNGTAHILRKVLG